MVSTAARAAALQPADAGPNGARGNQGHFLASLTNPLELIGQSLQAVRRQPAIRTREYVGPDLDDHGGALGNDFLADRIDHGFCR